MKEGNVVVRIYPRSREASGKGFCYDLADHSSGRRKIRTFHDLDEATAEAKSIARKLNSGQASALAISAKDAASFGRATTALEGTGVELEIAATITAEAIKIVGSVAVILEACREWKATHAGVIAFPVEKAVESLLEAKRAQGASERYMQDLASRLGRFADAFKVNVSDVTTPTLQAWIEGLKVSAATMRNFRVVIGTFFGFAKSRGWCSTNPAEGLTISSVRSDEEPEVFTVEEFGRLLQAASKAFLPCLVLGGFCGLRSAEIERTHWEDINLADREVVVRRGTAKTKSRRVIPLPDAAVEWLADYRDKKGPVWAGEHEHFYDAQAETASRTEVRDDGGRVVRPAVLWKQNGLRHGFGSAHLAMTGDAVRTAHYMGNSPEVVHAHYKALMGAAQGNAWFAIRPTKPANVVSMPSSPSIREINSPSPTTQVEAMGART